MNTLLRFFTGITLVVVTLAIVGCGDPAGTINGMVKNGDKPVQFAFIEINPKDPEGRSFRGETVDDGKYYLDSVAASGMPPGQYEAVITYHTLRNGDPLPAGEEGENMKSNGKTKEHKVVVDFEVKVGSHDFDFDVAQGRPAK